MLSKKNGTLETTSGSDNKRQAEMPYFHCGHSKQEQF